MSHTIIDKKQEVKLALFVVTRSILMTVKDQENIYNIRTNQREYVKNLNLTLNVLIPNKTESIENENRDTSLAVISGPSGCGVCINNGASDVLISNSLSFFFCYVKDKDIKKKKKVREREK